MATKSENSSRASELRSSPLRHIQPLHKSPITVKIDDLEDDPTNPGTVTVSLRYQRREPSIRDSYDILGSIIYPVIVCEHEDPAKREQRKYIVIDGHGRLHQARQRGQEDIEAIVYRAMNLEERICFRANPRRGPGVIRPSFCYSRPEVTGTDTQPGYRQSGSC